MAKEYTQSLDKVIKIDEGKIQEHLGEMVRGTVEETLNKMLDAEADKLCNAERYQRTHSRTDTRAGYYQRKLHTKAGEVKLNVPKLRQQKFETAIIERYKRRESSVEEAMVEMYLAGVSVRRVEDITHALWGTRVSPGTVSNLNKKIYKHIEAWRNRPITGNHPYLYPDGSVGDFYPEAKWQRCIVHFYRNVFSVVPRGKMNEVSRMLAIHASEDKPAAVEKANAIVQKLKEKKLRSAAQKVEQSIMETLTYYDFPSKYWGDLPDSGQFYQGTVSQSLSYFGAFYSVRTESLSFCISFLGVTLIFPSNVFLSFSRSSLIFSALSVASGSFIPTLLRFIQHFLSPNVYFKI